MAEFVAVVACVAIGVALGIMVAGFGMAVRAVAESLDQVINRR